MINLYKFSLLISIFLTIIGVMLRIMHWPGASLILSLATLVSLIYILIALMEIYKSKDKSLTEKFLWLIGFIVLSFIMGLIYYYNEMKPKNTVK